MRRICTTVGTVAVLIGLASCSLNDSVAVEDDVDVAAEDVFVEAAGYSGQLVGEDEATFEISDDDERFTPSIDDVDVFEAALLKDLDPQITEPADYYRLYYGHRRGDVSYLYVSAFCNASFEGRALPSPGQLVDDGGDCYWQASFNFETGLIESFWVNGQS